jgi:hypothetical protein
LCSTSTTRNWFPFPSISGKGSIKPAQAFYRRSGGFLQFKIQIKGFPDGVYAVNGYGLQDALGLYFRGMDHVYRSFYRFKGVFGGEPMFPTMVSPVLMPMPISRLGLRVSRKFKLSSIRFISPVFMEKMAGHGPRPFNQPYQTTLLQNDQLMDI